ncbi:hypothetical protein JVU11DRAFT_13132 [Chiua virens]|nr:hypothetical protein JVU11DRAFT_13132 [Chiua virens]
MPVTRASSRQNSQQPSSQPYATRRAGLSGNGDAKKTPTRTLKSKKLPARPVRKKATTSTAPLVTSGDVLELSSDEDSCSKKKRTTRKQVQSFGTADKDAQRTIKKLKEELKRAERQLELASREVEELKRKRDCSSKDALSGLEEYTSCEVCTVTMWSPYTLSECGHSFCKECLIDWFSRAQAQHMTANPHLDAYRGPIAGQLHNLVQMVPNLHAYGPHGQNHLRAILVELQRHRPEYNCPTCRKEVLNKPVEDFRLKGLITEIAERMGETNSHEGMTSHPGPGPFDDLFAAPIAAT